MNSKEDELYRLAGLVWGENVGQCIVGKARVSVFPLNGDRPLFHLDHSEAFRLARMFLGRLAYMAARAAGSTPPASAEPIAALPPPARDPREGLEEYCLGCNQPTSQRDCGCPAGVGYRKPSPESPAVDPNAPRAATVWDPAKVPADELPADELAQLAFGPGPDEK